MWITFLLFSPNFVVDKKQLESLYYQSMSVVMDMRITSEVEINEKNLPTKQT